MKKLLITTIACLCIHICFSQEKKLLFRGFASPSLCSSPTVNRIFRNGVITEKSLSRKSNIFFGGGIQLLKKIDKDLFLGGEFGFTPKGFLATRDTFYQNGSRSGSSFNRDDLYFLESTIFLEKQIIQKESKLKYIISSGLFYGARFPSIYRQDVKTHGNDLGASISLGGIRNNTFVKIDYRQGLIDLNNYLNADFKTKTISLKVGFTNL